MPFARSFRPFLLAAFAVVVAVAAVVGVAVAAPDSYAAGTSPAETVPSGSLNWASTPAPAPTPGPGSSAEKAVFTLLNQQRARHGLKALVWSSALATAATRHNAAMSAANQLSHQLPGEASFDQRISNAGYRWRWCAENIGWNSNTSDAGAVALQNAFYNETPPNDGHRRNILSTSAVHVGIDVLVDARGKLWVTEDFGAPA